MGLEGNKKHTREQKEPEGLTKKKKKMLEGKNEPEPPNKAVVSNQVAPPESKELKHDMFAAPLPSSSELPPAARGPGNHENERSPALSEQAAALLRALPARQFFAPGGARAGGPVIWKRRGYLDLYSGRAEVARQLSKQFGIWVLTFDFEHGENQDLLDPAVRQQIEELVRAGAFLGVGAAIECRSFSRAITPAVRDREFPYGKPNLTENMTLRVEQGNSHALFVLRMVLLCKQLQLVYWVENPDGSFLWLLPEWMESQLASAENSYRFDMCRYNTPWRKRTRIANNTSLAGKRELCCGGHSHLVLRGRSGQHQACWTRVAQVYPLALARRLAGAVGKAAGLTRSEISHLHIGACAKAGTGRIGEAAHPGPRRAVRAPRLRNPEDLQRAPLVGVGTRALQHRVWRNFEKWLGETFSDETRQQVFLCAPLGVQVLRRYGLHVYQTGGRLYEV